MNDKEKEIADGNLADLIWLLKGIKFACKKDDIECPFGEYHIESLRQVRINYLQKKEEK